MKKCNSCLVEINTISSLCPLCQNKLTGTDEQGVFPQNIRLKTSSLLFKILLFISLTVMIVTVFINYSLDSQLTWSIIVFLGLFSNILITKYILKNYKNMYKLLSSYGLLIIIISFIWFFVTRKMFITNYIIPSLCIVELTFSLVIAFILRKTDILKYYRILLINVILSLIPALIVLFKLTTFNILAYACSIYSLIVILGLIIFSFDKLKEELGKLFNI